MTFLLCASTNPLLAAWVRASPGVAMQEPKSMVDVKTQLSDSRPTHQDGSALKQELVHAAQRRPWTGLPGQRAFRLLLV